MAVKETTIKRLFAKSGNQCALPRCTSPLVIGTQVLAEMCHIRARRRGGPRFDASLTQEEKDDFSNLILLCGTCHTRVDKDPATWTTALLADIKEMHERGGSTEIDKEIETKAMQIWEKLQLSAKITGNTATATTGHHGVSIAVGGDNHGPITIKASSRSKGTYYPPNSIGADANLTNYIEYLCQLYVDYMQPIDTDAKRLWGKLGKHIKSRFRLAKRTRNHLPAERFHELVDYLIHEKLAGTPIGAKHLRNGKKLCCTFEEFRNG